MIGKTLIAQIALAEGNPAFRPELEQLIRHTPGLALAASFPSTEPLIAAAHADIPPWDLAILDLGLASPAAIHKLKEQVPELRILVLAASGNPSRILDAIAAGADGYALKSSPAHLLIAAVRVVLAGELHLSRPVAKAVLDILRAPARLARDPGPHPCLTARERAVLQQLALGRTYRQIAESLGVSLETVRTHLRAVYGKLGVSNSAAAVAKAIRGGLA